MPPPEFTLTLFRRDLSGYTAWARSRSGDGDDEGKSAQTEFQLDPVRLSRAWAAPDAYGAALTAAVFAGDVLTLWRAARSAAPGQPAVRVRLEIQESALDLHRVRWETLRDPDHPERPLLTGQTYWFSRHLPAGWEGSRGHGRTRAAARALVVVAAPRDLAGRDLLGATFEAADVFDAAAEVAAIRARLGALTPEVAVLPDGGRRATLANITAALRDGVGYDVLYLVAHGGLDGTKPVLMLENDAGELAVTDAAKLAAEVGQLRYPPRLAVLSSCRSAGDARPYRPVTGNGELDAALGPQLGRAGVSAVVAMVGDVFQQTADAFIGAFFAQLVATGGQLDRAAAEARHAVHLAGRTDYWSPVLYTRLGGGRLWRDPAAARVDWLPGLVDRLRDWQIIPVLGSGVLDPVLGSTQALARRLIGRKDEGDPAAPSDLPRAAQYAVTVQRRPMPGQYLTALAEQVRAEYPDLGALPPVPKAAEDARRLLADELGESAPAQAAGLEPLPRRAREARRLLAAAADRVKAKHPPEPHDILARLTCPVYISTNPDDLLGRALDRRGKKPAIRVCNWLPAADRPPGSPPPGSPPDGPDEPEPDSPLVYHLFGHLSDPASLVLSEDDYFKFLVGISNENAARRASSRDAPRPMSYLDARLSGSGLLFLGFRLDDWDFRAFLHFFLNREAARNRPDTVLDVAVQLDPADGRASDPDLVRRYLEGLFNKPKINIYWGSTEEFLQELDAICPR